jgi:hypothetical protein
MISEVKREDGVLQVRTLTFGRNYIVYRFNEETFALESCKLEQVASFEYSVSQIGNYEASLS